MKNYSWLSSIRTFLYDAYWPLFAPELRYEAAKGVELCQRAGANAIRFGSIGKRALYQSEIMPHHPDLGERDLLAETIEVAKPHNIKIIAYIPVGHALPQVLVDNQKPEWRYLLDDKQAPTPMTHFGGEPVVPVCSFGAYYQDILKIVREISSYDVDAIYLDGPYQGWDCQNTICQCESCREHFKADTRLELPSNSEKDKSEDPLMHQRLDTYLRWNRSKLLNLLRDIKSICSPKELPLMMNRTAARFSGSIFERKMLQEVDCMLIETDYDDVEGCGVAGALDKMIWSYSDPHGHHPRLSSAKSERKALMKGRRALALGAVPIISYAGRFFNNETHMGYIKKLLRESRLIEESLASLALMPKACLLRRSDEKKFVAASLSDDSNSDASLNICSSFKSVGEPIVAVPDIYLDSQSFPFKDKVDVFFLTKQVSLTESRIEFLKNFIEDGGTVVFSGIVPPEFAGLTREEPSESLLNAFQNQYWLGGRYDCYLRIDGRGLMPQVESIPLTPILNDVEIVAESIIFDAKGELSYPSVFVRKLGKGTCVCFDSPIEEVLTSDNNEIDIFFRELCLGKSTTLPIRILENPSDVEMRFLENVDSYAISFVSENQNSKVCFQVDESVTPENVLDGELKKLEKNRWKLKFSEFEMIKVKKLQPN